MLISKMQNYADALTLEQLQVLVAVADEGSFSAAARALHRSQGAISYQVANLETQLGFPVFIRTGRRPTLTAAGRGVCTAARHALNAIDQVREQAWAYGQGQATAVSLTLDVLFPSTILVSLLQRFQADFPGVRVDLSVAVRQRAVARLVAGDSELGVVPEPDHLVAAPAFHVELVPVAAPSLGLGVGSAPLSDGVLRAHTHLILSDGGESKAGDGDGVQAPDGDAHVWRINDSRTRHELVLQGLGWCRLPRHEVADDLRSGRLVALNVKVPRGCPLHVPLFVAHRRGQVLSSAARWWFDALQVGVADRRDGVTHPS